MWHNTQCRNTHCHNTQAFWIIDYKSKYKSSSVKITTGKIFRTFEWVLWKFLDEKCIFQMICTHGTHDKVRLKNASMIWYNLRLEKGEIWYKHFFQTIYLFSIFLNYQIYIKHYDLYLLRHRNSKNYLLPTLCVLDKKFETSAQNFLCIIFWFTEAFGKGWNETSWARGFLGVRNVVDSGTKFLAMRDEWKIEIISIFGRKSQDFSRMCLLISCLIYWHNSHPIQIKFCEKILKR